MIDKFPSAPYFLLTIPLVALIGHYGYEQYLVDVCNDQGGSFNYEAWRCSSDQNYRYSPYINRHWGKATLALSLSLSGLIVYLINRFKNR